MHNRGHPYISIFCLLLFQSLIIAQEMPLTAFLVEIEQEYEVTFNYNVEAVANLTIHKTQEISSLGEALSILRTHTPFLYRKVGETIITMLQHKSTTFCGYLRDKETQEIITKAFITQGDTPIPIALDGYFEFELGPSRSITINALGYKQVLYDSRLSDQNKCTILYLSKEQVTLAPLELSSYIVKGINKLSDDSFQIDFKSFSLLPGLIETDVLQATQALPGIQSTDETVSDINIRGGSNDQNLILWDGIKMYQSGHFFGLISAFNPNITQSVSVKKNGTDASYTDGVSGTISMQTDREIAQSTSGSLGLSMLSADGFADIALNKKSSVQFSLRHSINDILQTPTYDSYFTRISQETEVSTNDENITNSNQDFNFYDGSLRWLYQIGNNDKLRLNFLTIGNNLSFTETANTITLSESRNSSLAQNSISGSLYYEHTWNTKSKTQLHYYETDYTLRAKNANVLSNQRLLQENIVSESSVRLQHDLKRNKQWRFSGGYHFTESGITNLTEVDNPLFRERITEVVRTHGLFGQGYFSSLLQKTNLSLGLRTTYLDKFEKTILEPRFTLSHRLSPGFTISALGEFKHQTTSQIISLQNDFLGIEKRRWQLANNADIPILKSKQASVGIRYKKNGWLIDGTGYYKTVDGITTQSQGFDTKYEFTRTNGSYDVTGIDLLIRKNMGAFNTWLSYGYMDNQYTFAALEEISFPSNFDITHTITLGATYAHKKWKISSGLNWHTGQPTTIPIIGNDILGGAVNFGSANNSRLSAYVRVDGSAVYELVKNDHIRLETGLSLWNILDTTNRVGTFYRVIDQEVIPFEETALGMTANATMRLYF